MKHLITIILALVFVFSSTAQAEEPSPALGVENCRQYIPFGIPQHARQNTAIVCRAGYILEYDNAAKIPRWVSYLLTPEHAVGCFPRTNTFRQDPAIEDQYQSTNKDYAKSGYDIGHMANNADMRWTKQAEIDANVLSNTAPQRPGLNRGAWKELEDQIRVWAVTRNHPILIYVGPIYPTKGATVMRNTSVVIPTAFYKILIDVISRDTIAFIYPNAASNNSPSSFVTSIAEVQRQSGITFKLPNKTTPSFAPWPLPVKSNRAAKAAACSIN